ncbi:hypothetical protein OV203_17555 [Nannocystis sp. ILAH1]|uniref:hypothetical protein n=1 Tax=unclassified Nannocystis TaxID=2627009 RepID=UPI00226FCEF4|nr:MULTISPECIES: hypothetical protein [unclassified Nannocystis]MCY0988946.1 hypothetical protein [Nannocystis sp. ILAH1]MCY1072629.1 hypothetical protein [Nannocystis sp. RBIL2]
MLKIGVVAARRGAAPGRALDLQLDGRRHGGLAGLAFREPIITASQSEQDEREPAHMGKVTRGTRLDNGP